MTIGWRERMNEWVSERVSVGGVMAVKWKTQKEKGKRYGSISEDDFAGQPSKHFEIENVNWAWWEKERERGRKRKERVRRMMEGGWTYLWMSSCIWIWNWTHSGSVWNTAAYWYLVLFSSTLFTPHSISSQSHLLSSSLHFSPSHLLVPPLAFPFLCLPHLLLSLLLSAFHFSFRFHMPDGLLILRISRDSACEGLLLIWHVNTDMREIQTASETRWPHTDCKCV